MQLEGLFAVAPSKHSEVRWSANVPCEDRPWSIGLIVGASGSGKTTVAREMFGNHIVSGFDWPRDKSVVDAFPESLPIKETVSLLNSVGFSDPPSWLRPFGVLSNGEQFRVSLARAIAEKPELFVFDEFTSVVDRQVARIGSAAIARAVRQRNQKFIAVACHYDIIDWLQPDWMYEPGTDSFQWRELQRRPTITLEICRVDKKAWSIFRHHHYLDTDLAPSAQCFCGLIEGQPATFCAVLPFPHAIRPGWRLHRLVCLPDYQGVGVGTAMSDYVSGLYRASGKPVFRTAGHPAVVHHCAKSKVWKMLCAPSRAPAQGKSGNKSLGRTQATDRLTAGFEYIGPAHREDAMRFGLRVG
jgi:ABC-type thiamine transport system ATPase subunit/GNAT superfamily N-acetyltransferase